MGEKEQDDRQYDFIKEKIKDKPINKRRLLIRFGLSLALGAAFGAAACLTFVFLKPVLEDWAQLGDSQAITIPKDDDPAQAERADSVLSLGSLPAGAESAGGDAGGTGSSGANGVGAAGADNGSAGNGGATGNGANAAGTGNGGAGSGNANTGGAGTGNAAGGGANGAGSGNANGAGSGGAAGKDNGSTGNGGAGSGDANGGGAGSGNVGDNGNAAGNAGSGNANSTNGGAGSDDAGGNGSSAGNAGNSGANGGTGNGDASSTAGGDAESGNAGDNGNAAEGTGNPGEEQPQGQGTDLGLTDYQSLQEALYAVGRDASKSMVTVTGVESDVDWFHAPYERENQAVGVIIGKNGKDLLVLTEKRVTAEAQVIEVTFPDDTQAEASLKNYDGNTGIAVIGVALSDIPDRTMEQTETASLGNSYLVSQGTAVLALGIPSEHMILSGTVTSSQNSVSTIDANYSILTTDIAGSEDWSGVLLNLEGEIVGLSLPGYNNGDGRNTVTGLAISELKQVIEDLSNKRDMPYVGLRVSTVTDEIATAYGLPKGVYVKALEMDSPAMEAGLQEADVIVGINGEEIKSVEEYSQKVYGFHPDDVITITVKRQSGEDYVDLDCAVTVGVLR